MSTAVWWMRRDLRLHGNAALTAALGGQRSVVPLFVLDQELLSAKDISSRRLAFLFEGLRQLDHDLQDRGSRLIVRRGAPLQELSKICKEVQADCLYAERDPWPYAVQRDARIQNELPMELVDGLTLHAPEAVTKADGSPYTVFTPYARLWKRTGLPTGVRTPPAPQVLPPVREDISSEPIPPSPEPPPWGGFVPGEVEARRRLDAFTLGEDAPIFDYSESRNQLDRDRTSKLSPYLRFGMLSTIEVVEAAERAIISAPDATKREGAETWLDQLIWREFFMSIVFHFPTVLDQSFRASTRSIRWLQDHEGFEAWKKGQTGYPLVDAAMRQLLHTGWMHNRARMIVASFLCKDLLVDWRWGEQHFMQQLLDADPAANNGGWQWTAGTGTDAAPYFRIFNPVLQGKKHDPEGQLVRQWVPELREVPDKYIQSPWLMTTELQRRSGCIIGKDYPQPIVDHKLARQRALSAYAASRDQIGE